MTDVTNDVSGRDLETELPSSLEFRLTRGTRDEDFVTLQLEENKRLNQNAPMYRTMHYIPGVYEAVRVQDDKPLTVISFIKVPLKVNLFLCAFCIFIPANILTTKKKTKKKSCVSVGVGWVVKVDYHILLVVYILYKYVKAYVNE